MEKDSVFLQKLGKRVRDLRQQKGLSLVDFASIVDKDYQSLQRVERGSVNPTIQYLKQLADGLEMELWELLMFED